MRLLFASHTAPGGVFRVGSHHLARELATQGHEVCHLSSPVSLLHLISLRDPEVVRRYRLALRRVRPAVAGDFVPLTLLPMSLGPRLNSGPGLRTAVPGLRRSLRRLGFDRVDALVVDQPLLAGLEHHVDADVVVYRSTDRVESRAKLAGETRVLARADGLVGTSAPVLEGLLAQRPGLPSLVLENGVEFGHFDRPPPAGQREGAVYVGAIDERFDWSSVSAMAASNPDVPISVWGPAPDAPDGLPGNVEVRGPVAYDDVPGVLSRARVGLLPFRRNPMNEGRSPMKLYEYLTAGLNVVTTLPLSAQQREVPGVWSVDDEGASGEALRHAHTAQVNGAGVEVARTMDWAGRATRLVEFVDELRRRPSTPR